NRIRHELLPLLRTHYQPGLDTTIGRVMKIISAEAEFISQQVSQVRRRAKISFGKLHPALQRGWLRAECQGLKIHCDFDLIEQLRTQSGTQVMVATNTVICRDDFGHLHTQKTACPKFRVEEQSIRLSAANGFISFGGVSLWWRLLNRL